MGIRRRLAMVACVVALLPVGGCTSSAPEPGISTVDWTDHDHRAEQVVMALVNGDYSVVASGFDKDMSNALSVKKLREAWEGTVEQAGDFVTITGSVIVPDDQYDIRDVTSQHTKQGVTTRVVFSATDKISGLFLTLVANPPEVLQTPTPRDGFTDYPAVVGQGSDYPLDAILSIPDDASQVPAVVLVHGSGPEDMNETVFGISVFEDLADCLASRGIAVLRYNKRTYSYPDKVEQQYGDKLTVEEETIKDAILAKDLLADDPRIDPDRIFVVGHSLGGMLAPRIVSEGAFAGGVIMAGSPRSLLDIMYDQNLYQIGLMNLTDDERAAKIKEVDQARTTYFGMPAAYIEEMDAHPAESYLEGNKPFFIIQGSKDFQVFPETDFAAYIQIAQGKPNLTTQLYEGLTHLFTVSTMDHPTVDDYVPGSHVDPAPLKDITAWILSH